MPVSQSLHMWIFDVDHVTHNNRRNVANNWKHYCSELYNLRQTSTSVPSQYPHTPGIFFMYEPSPWTPCQPHICETDRDMREQTDIHTLFRVSGGVIHQTNSLLHPLLFVSNQQLVRVIIAFTCIHCVCVCVGLCGPVQVSAGQGVPCQLTVRVTLLHTGRSTTS